MSGYSRGSGRPMRRDLIYMGMPSKGYPYIFPINHYRGGGEGGVLIFEGSCLGPRDRVNFRRYANSAPPPIIPN